MGKAWGRIKIADYQQLVDNLENTDHRKHGNIAMLIVWTMNMKLMMLSNEKIRK